MAYDLTKIPVQSLLQPIAEATAAFVRLDERLKQSRLGSGSLERLNFHDACASHRMTPQEFDPMGQLV